MIKNYFRILKNLNAYLQAILKAHVHFQKDRPKTVGGVKGTRYLLPIDFCNIRTQKMSMFKMCNQRTDSPKSLLACKVLMECCVSSMQFYTIHAKKIDDIPMLPILYDKMELYGIYQASGHCTS